MSTLPLNSPNELCFPSASTQPIFSIDLPFSGGIGRAVGGGFDTTGAFELPGLSLLLQAQTIVSTRTRRVSVIDRQKEIALFIRFSVRFVISLNSSHFFFW